MRILGIIVALIIVTQLVTCIPVTASSLSITVATDKPSYLGGENIYIHGALTYDYSPVPNNLVGVEVQDPNNNTLLMMTQQTDSAGKYMLTFRLPSFSEPGTYTVSVASHYYELTATNRTTFVVKPAKAIYIRADGSIDPPTAPIYSADNVTYSFTDNIYDSIVICRSNIVVDGTNHVLKGTKSLDNIGFRITRDNVTIKNTHVRGFWFGLDVASVFGCVIARNNVTNNVVGMRFYSSSHGNVITGNWIAKNDDMGIELSINAEHNTINQNKIVSNKFGIVISSNSSHNVIKQNIIAKNDCGMMILRSSQNSFYHNNFLRNTVHIKNIDSNNTWNDDYPSGGNYWSSYTVEDLYSGPYQNETGSDGIGDKPYVIDANNIDRYPLVNLYHVKHDVGVIDVTASRTVIWEGFSLDVSITIGNYGAYTEIFNATVYVNATLIFTFANITLTKANLTTLTFTWDSVGIEKGKYAISVYVTSVIDETDVADNQFIDGLEVILTRLYDVDGDGKIDLKDIYLMTKAYGSFLGHPKWNPNCDINGDDKIDLKDYYVVCKNFGAN